MPTPNEIAKLLENAGVKATANRISIARELNSATSPLSLNDLADKLETIDRSNVFRALTLFREHHLVHVIEDGSDSVKYELCRNHGGESHDDLHVHFYCEKCGRTICLEEIHTPQVKLPKEFDQHSINYMIKGICPDCNEA